MTVSYTDTCITGLKGFFYLPKGLGNSADVVDKFCKMALQVFECNHHVTQSFKDTTGLASTFGFISTLKALAAPKFKPWPHEKIASKIVLLFAQCIDVVKGLDTLKLASLANISNAMGRCSVFSHILKFSPALSVTKDSLIFLSTGLSIKVNYDESSDLHGKNINKISMKEIDQNIEDQKLEAWRLLASDRSKVGDVFETIGRLLEKKKERELHEKKVNNNRIAMITDLFKIAIVGLMLGIALYGAGMSTVLFTTGYGALTLGKLVNAVGLISAGTALIKVLHTYATAQK